MKVSLFILSTMLIIIIIIDHFQSKNLFAQLFWPVPGIIYRGRRWSLRSGGNVVAVFSSCSWVTNAERSPTVTWNDDFANAGAAGDIRSTLTSPIANAHNANRIWTNNMNFIFNSSFFLRRCYQQIEHLLLNLYTHTLMRPLLKFGRNSHVFISIFFALC